MLKRIAITSLAAAAVFSTATVAMAPVTPAAAQVSVTFGSPPPAPIYEAVPAPRAGYVWAPGHYLRPPVRTPRGWLPTGCTISAAGPSSRGGGDNCCEFGHLVISSSGHLRAPSLANAV